MAGSQVIESFNNFAGGDIVVAINDVVFGEIQQITYRIRREVGGLYTMGSPNPRGFAKNKRFIDGAMTFLVFDRDALLHAVKNCKDIFNKNAKWGYTAAANFNDYGAQTNIALWNQTQQDLYNSGKTFTQLSAENIRYADQIPPFTITISMANEYGASASMAIYGVQIVNEGAGVSIDDLVSEKAVSFLATDVRQLDTIQVKTKNQK